MKKAYIFRRKGRLLIGPASITTRWSFDVSAGPWTELEGNGPTTQKGQAAAHALSIAGRSMPHPSNSGEWKALNAPLLQAAGVASWNTLMKGCDCVFLEEEGRVLRLIPARNAGADGFQKNAAGNMEEISADASPEELGAALERALEKCE